MSTRLATGSHGARTFSTAEEFAAYQARREVREAMRVQAMSGDELGAWLARVWDPLQRQAGILAGDRVARRPRVRSYATLDDKNADERKRELAAALRSSVMTRRP